MCIRDSSNSTKLNECNRRFKAKRSVAAVDNTPKSVYVADNTMGSGSDVTNRLVDYEKNIYINKIVQ